RQALGRVGVAALLQRQDNQPLSFGGLVRERNRLIQVLKEFLGGRRSEGEVVVRQGERRILGRRLLEQLAGIVRLELIGERAALGVERPRLAGRGADQDLGVGGGSRGACGGGFGL